MWREETLTFAPTAVPIQLPLSWLLGLGEKSHSFLGQIAVGSWIRIRTNVDATFSAPVVQIQFGALGSCSSGKKEKKAC